MSSWSFHVQPPSPLIDYHGPWHLKRDNNTGQPNNEFVSSCHGANCTATLNVQNPYEVVSAGVCIRRPPPLDIHFHPVFTENDTMQDTRCDQKEGVFYSWNSTSNFTVYTGSSSLVLLHFNLTMRAKSSQSACIPVKSAFHHPYQDILYRNGSQPSILNFTGDRIALLGNSNRQQDNRPINFTVAIDGRSSNLSAEMSAHLNASHSANSQVLFFATGLAGDNHTLRFTVHNDSDLNPLEYLIVDGSNKSPSQDSALSVITSTTTRDSTSITTTTPTSTSIAPIATSNGKSVPVAVLIAVPSVLVLMLLVVSGYVLYLRRHTKRRQQLDSDPPPTQPDMDDWPTTGPTARSETIDNMPSELTTRSRFYEPLHWMQSTPMRSSTVQSLTNTYGFPKTETAESRSQYSESSLRTSAETVYAL
ncbi:hypothetical protein MIND_01211900 [Mycena indigotica]|uniref:Uncharacterized protein n=1 Tax=Mycena indigotica TaxID=2126181 RepID=A0A8H6S4H3_9AGAR|nr:uncharacterized protein MIND_01211900 [Mycena indigotica]KAF7291866.1 hypothetical protein MIND_01211900 [Mycena indigotica]